MDKVMEIWSWLLNNGSVYVVVALGISEALASVDVIKSNSIFQFVHNALVWVKDKLVKKPL